MDFIHKSISKEIESALKQAGNVVIITHINPDGDAIGSSLGLYHYLKSAGKAVHVITPNSYPAFLHWLPGNSEILEFNQAYAKAKKLISEADILFHLDFNDPGRMDAMKDHVSKNSKATKILIDHHPKPVAFNDIEISDIRASSTAELVFYLIKALNGKLLTDRTICECLFTGIMTDTGCFSFNSSLPSTYQAVASIMESGIDKDRIYNLVYNNFSEARMKLLGYGLDKKMKVINQYHTAFISLSEEELKKYNFNTGDSEGFVNFPLSIKGIRFSALFLEKKDHVKISFRSHGNFPVNEFSAKHFNGGGHLNAAGGESYHSLDDTIKMFISLLPEYNNWLM